MRVLIKYSKIITLRGFLLLGVLLCLLSTQQSLTSFEFEKPTTSTQEAVISIPQHPFWIILNDRHMQQLYSVEHLFSTHASVFITLLLSLLFPLLLSFHKIVTTPQHQPVDSGWTRCIWLRVFRL